MLKEMEPLSWGKNGNDLARNTSQRKFQIIAVVDTEGELDLCNWAEDPEVPVGLGLVG